MKDFQLKFEKNFKISHFMAILNCIETGSRPFCLKFDLLTPKSDWPGIAKWPIEEKPQMVFEFCWSLYFHSALIWSWKSFLVIWPLVDLYKKVLKGAVHGFTFWIDHDRIWPKYTISRGIYCDCLKWLSISIIYQSNR